MQPKVRVAFHILNAAMLVFFVIAIALQVNDPDGIVWMTIYGYATVVTALAFQRIPILLSCFGTVAYLIFAYVHFPVLDGPFLENEAARESGGLIITGAYMLVLSIIWLWSWRRAARIYAGNAQSQVHSG